MTGARLGFAGLHSVVNAAHDLNPTVNFARVPSPGAVSHSRRPPISYMRFRMFGKPLPVAERKPSSDAVGVGSPGFQRQRINTDHVAG